MISLSKHIANLVNKFEDHHFFVGLSGGLDSMVLLHLLCSHHQNITALHVNYKLRGSDSDKDENHVKQETLKLNVPIIIHHVTIDEQNKMKKGNLQLEARKIRYDFFKKEASKKKHSKIFVAHHLDDQVETFFLQLTRGSGIAGLSGMQAQSEVLIRPLLPFTKNEILIYAKSNAVLWREDTSNNSLKYLRNRLRNAWIPLLEKNNPNIRESVLKIQSLFQENLKEIRQSVESLKFKIVDQKKIMFDEFDELSDVFLVELLRSLGLPGSILIELRKLRIAQKGSKINLNDFNVFFDSIIRESNSFFFHSNSDQIMTPDFVVKHVKRLPNKFNKEIVYIDKHKIKGDLSIRLWEIGDKIKPIGMNGSKLISDVITDAKIPHHKRNSRCVLIDSEKILWCVGLSVDRRAVANSKTKHILKVSIA